MDFSKTPLMLAAERGNLNMVRMLIERRSKAELDVTCRSTFCLGNTALLLAAEKGHFEIVKLLLEANANPNATDRNGNTAVHFAAKRGETAILQLLIDCHADLEMRTHRFGRTALWMTVRDHTFEDGVWSNTPSTRRAVIEMLIRGNADVGAKDTWFKDDVVEMSFKRSGYSCIDLDDSTAEKLCPRLWQRLMRAMAPGLSKVL
jgi:ankyrin repeat protein